MTREDLQRVRDWADDRLASGSESPWARYQFVQLRESVHELLSGMDMDDVVPAEQRASIPQTGTGAERGQLRIVGGHARLRLANG